MSVTAKIEVERNGANVFSSMSIYSGTGQPEGFEERLAIALQYTLARALGDLQMPPSDGTKTYGRMSVRVLQPDTAEPETAVLATKPVKVPMRVGRVDTRGIWEIKLGDQWIGQVARYGWYEKDDVIREGERWLASLSYQLGVPLEAVWEVDAPKETAK